MRKYAAQLFIAAVAFSGGLFVATTVTSVQSQTQPGLGFAAVPGEKGGWDLTGPYEVVRDWPKPLSELPGHEAVDMGSDGGRFRRERRPGIRHSAWRVAEAAASVRARVSGRRTQSFISCWRGAVPA